MSPNLHSKDFRVVGVFDRGKLIIMIQILSKLSREGSGLWSEYLYSAT